MQVLKSATVGLKLEGDSLIQVRSLILTLQKSSDEDKIIFLLKCLKISETNSYNISVCTEIMKSFRFESGDQIEEVVQFTHARFNENVTLTQVAKIACMSVASFCRNFKCRMQRTYFEYLNEVRVSFACRQLGETFKTVKEIGYESGYNSVSHFHRQFLKCKKVTPLKYRKNLFSAFI